MKTLSAVSNQSGIQFNTKPKNLSCRSTVAITPNPKASPAEIAHSEALTEAVSQALIGTLPRIVNETKGVLVQVDSIKEPKIIASGHVKHGRFIPRTDQKMPHQLAEKELLLFIPQEVLAMQIDLHGREIADPVDLRKITPARIEDLLDLVSASRKTNYSPIRALQTLQVKSQKPATLAKVFQEGTDLVLLDFSTGKAIPVAPAKVRNLALNSFEAALHAADIKPKHQELFHSRNKVNSIWVPREFFDKKIA